MADVSFFTGHINTLSSLSPSEQAVYVRLSVMSEHGKVRGRYADIAKLVNVSISTFKRVMKSLSARAWSRWCGGRRPHRCLSSKKNLEPGPERGLRSMTLSLQR